MRTKPLLRLRYHLILLVLSVAIASQPLSAQTSALPAWPRRFAPAIVEGHIIGHPIGQETWPGYSSNRDNILGDLFPQEEHDTLGHFRLRFDICYPLVLSFHQPTYRNLLLTPGDTLRIDFDRAALQAFKIATPADVFRMPVRISGPTAELQPAAHIANMFGASTYPNDRLYQMRREGYAAWREYLWQRHQDRLAAIDTIPLSAAQQEYVRMQSEVDYVEHCRNFLYFKQDFWRQTNDYAEAYPEYAVQLQQQGIDLDTLRLLATDTLHLYAFAEDMATHLADPHLADLTFFRSLNGAYVVHNLELWDWMEANGLADSPLGAWLQQLRRGQELVAEAKAFRSVNAARLDSLPAEMQAAVRAVQERNCAKVCSKGIKRELPEGKPAAWLPQIVSEHKGRTLFVDFWATWCGPCLQGIKAMEAVKDSLMAEGVDFIYITDSSSDTDGWLAHIAQHAGDHYIVPQSALGQMNIPAYQGGIPHYLIYRPDGTLFKAWSGWSILDYPLGLLREAGKE